jgi:hypothetical protein
MIQLFKSLRGEPKRDCAAKRPASLGDYRAVSIDLCVHCRAITRDLAGKRFLLREVPRLPLSRAASAASCSCKFRKHADRRDADRRALGETETHRWFAGAERRTRCLRRSARA